MRNECITILSAVDTSSQNGSAINANQLVSASFQPIFGDVTAAGTVKIQFSNDNPGTAYNFTPTNWTDIPNATSAIASGVGPGIVIANMAFQFIRAVYTRTGGGSTTVIVNMNAIGV
jgi:hypothetical protein